MSAPAFVDRGETGADVGFPSQGPAAQYVDRGHVDAVSEESTVVAFADTAQAVGKFVQREVRCVPGGEVFQIAVFASDGCGLQVHLAR